MEPIRTESMANHATGVRPQQRLFERYLGSIWRTGLVSPNTGVWVVFSRTGQVVDYGTGTGDLIRNLRAKEYPGVLLGPAFMGSVRTRKGQSVPIAFMWIPEDTPVQ